MVFGNSTFDEPGRAEELSSKVASIREEANRIKQQDSACINFDDIQKICSSLKDKKACGHDNIFYEHVKYGGNLLYKHLCHLFNLCLNLSYIPQDWRRSIIILLYKGDNKSRTDTNSYRGISLVPAITKIFEKAIDISLNRLRSDFPNSQQVAYQKGLSSLNASFNLQELILHQVEHNGSVITILLDSTRAFDTVTHNGLKIKLSEYGVTGKLWLLLDNMYSNLSSTVLCCGSYSRSFDLNRGVRQGSALSAKLYLIFINDLIEQLQSSQKGATL